MEKYKVDILIDNKWTPVRSQKDIYVFNDKNTAFQRIASSYGFLGYQGIKDIELDKRYTSVDSYRRELSIRVTKE